MAGLLKISATSVAWTPWPIVPVYAYFVGSDARIGESEDDVVSDVESSIISAGRLNQIEALSLRLITSLWPSSQTLNGLGINYAGLGPVVS